MNKTNMIFTLRALILCSLAFAGAACEVFGLQLQDGFQNSEGFAVYLAPENVYLRDIENIAEVGPEYEPLITQDDLVAYSQKTYEMILSREAADRLSVRELWGRVYLVSVDRQVVFVGEIMAVFMSRASESVVIIWPLKGQSFERLGFELGYPGSGDLIGADDPREDPRMLDALAEAQLLK